jgi:hypothetical protein
MAPELRAALCVHATYLPKQNRTNPKNMQLRQRSNVGHKN